MRRFECEQLPKFAQPKNEAPNFANKFTVYPLMQRPHSRARAFRHGTYTAGPQAAPPRPARAEPSIVFQEET